MYLNMQNALLRYHCNNGHASMPQYYVIRKFPILLLFYLATLSISTITWVCGVVAPWLKCCAINRKVAGSIPDGIIGIFH